MALHVLKSWTHFFKDIKAGLKLHDLRQNTDRNFKIGDVVLLNEYDNVNGRYTGDSLEAEISYITDRTLPCAFSSAVLPRDYSILSLKVL